MNLILIDSFYYRTEKAKLLKLLVTYFLTEMKPYKKPFKDINKHGIGPAKDAVCRGRIGSYSYCSVRFREGLEVGRRTIQTKN